MWRLASVVFWSETVGYTSKQSIAGFLVLTGWVTASLCSVGENTVVERLTLHGSGEWPGWHSHTTLGPMPPR